MFFTLEIGGIKVAAESEAELPFSLIGERYKPFINSLNKEPNDLFINFHYGELPCKSEAKKETIFISNALWRLEKCEGKDLFTFAFANEPTPYRVAFFNEDYTQGEIYSKEFPDSASQLPHYNPFAYPLFELLFISLLSRRGGALVHSCGLIAKEGRAFLFLGNSGNGKTTMAKVWGEQAEILNDERILLKFEDGRLNMYGTPWHGELDKVSPNGAAIEKIFFLRHGKTNHARPCSKTDAAAKMLTRAFIPLWEASGMSRSLDFIARATSAVECYDLEFTPEESAIDYIRGLK